MSAYQNYYPQIPMCQNSFNQPMQNPYMQQRMDNLQQFQQAMQPPMLTPIGKIVENLDIVKAMDIPMDGNTYYFPRADGTELYSKQWMANGQTRILTFKPVLNDSNSSVSQKTESLDLDIIKGFSDKLDALTDKIEKLEKYIKPTIKKKEVDTDV